MVALAAASASVSAAVAAAVAAAADDDYDDEAFVDGKAVAAATAPVSSAPDGG